MKLFASIFVLLLVSAATLPSSAREAPSDEGRGCCSHHKGVCGCKSGHTTCCDGTMSPSCLCVSPDE